MAIFLTADLHLGHARVAELRGFLNVEAHDTVVINNLCKIPSGSTLFILGDVAMGGWKRTILPLANLTVACGLEVHVILGNHDRPAPNNSNGHAYLGQFAQLGKFAGVATMARIAYDGRRVMLSHYPYNGDHDEDRFNEYRLRDNGFIVMHGHTHSNVALSLSDLGTPQINVGLDAWGLNPVSLSDAIAVCK